MKQRWHQRLQYFDLVATWQLLMAYVFSTTQINASFCSGSVLDAEFQLTQGWMDFWLPGKSFKARSCSTTLSLNLTLRHRTELVI